MVGGAIDILGDIEPAAAIVGDGLHRDIGDGQAAGHHTANGVGGVVGQQLRGIPLASREECSLQSPDAAGGCDLEPGSLVHISRSAHASVGQYQILLGFAVLQTVRRVARHCPQLVVSGGGICPSHSTVPSGQALAINSQGVVAAGVIDELNGAGLGNGGQPGEVCLHGPLRVAVRRNAVIAVGQRRIGVLVQHHNSIRWLIDMQAAVHADLHIAGVSAEIGHGPAGNAVLLGGIAGHRLLGRGVVQLTALGVDGLDQLGLALVFETAQLFEGTEHYAGGATAAVAAVGAAENTGAVVYTAAPQHIAQRHGVVVQIKGGDGGFQVVQQIRIGVGLPVVLLGLGELLRIIVAHAAPVGVEVAAVAGGVFFVDVVGVGLVQLVAHVAVEGAFLELLQPLDKAQRRPGVAGEHIDAVGRAAAISLDGGDIAGIRAVARLVVLAQVAQPGARPVFAGGQQCGGQQAQHQHSGQHDRSSSFYSFHHKHPAFISYW